MKVNFSYSETRLVNNWLNRFYFNLLFSNSLLYFEFFLSTLEDQKVFKNIKKYRVDEKKLKILRQQSETR